VGTYLRALFSDLVDSLTRNAKAEKYFWSRY